MPETPKEILGLLEQLRAERDELDVLIRGLEKRLGIVSDPAQAQTTLATSPRVTVSIDNIPVGFFHNLSQAQAAEKLLRMNPGQPLTSAQILNAMRKSGTELNPKNANTILYTTLGRNPKFERVAGKAWGLAEWYPKKKKVERTETDETEMNSETPESDESSKKEKRMT